MLCHASALSRYVDEILYNISQLLTLAHVKTKRLQRDDQPAPECTVTLQAPTLDEACVSEPCKLSDLGSYQVDFKAESKHSLATIADSLDCLINGFVSVDVSIGDSNIACAHLDLLPIAQGSASVQARLNLHPSQENGEHVLLPSSNITVAAHVTREDEHAGNVDVSSVPGESLYQQTRVPFHFLSERQATESAVASLSCIPTSDVPPAFMSAAAASSGGIQIRFGFMWLGDESPHGFSSVIGVCDGEQFHQKRKTRTLLCYEEFASLQDAVASGKSVYMEIARCGASCLDHFPLAQTSDIQRQRPSP